MNIEHDVIYKRPRTENERAAIAETCVLRLNLEMPMLLDRMSNEVDEAYVALPERLYAIDPDGKISWRSEPGPWGFDMKAWHAKIGKLTG